MHEAERQQLVRALTASTAEAAEAAAALPPAASAQALPGEQHVRPGGAEARAVVEMAGQVAGEMAAVTSGEKWGVWVEAEGDPAGREPSRLSTVTLPPSAPEAAGQAAGGAAADRAAAGGAAGGSGRAAAARGRAARGLAPAGGRAAEVLAAVATAAEAAEVAEVAEAEAVALFVQEAVARRGALVEAAEAAEAEAAAAAPRLLSVLGRGSSRGAVADEGGAPAAAGAAGARGAAAPLPQRKPRPRSAAQAAQMRKSGWAATDGDEVRPATLRTQPAAPRAQPATCKYPTQPHTPSLQHPDAAQDAARGGRTALDAPVLCRLRRTRARTRTRCAERGRTHHGHAAPPCERHVRAAAERGRRGTAAAGMQRTIPSRACAARGTLARGALRARALRVHVRVRVRVHVYLRVRMHLRCICIYVYI